jgi:hypothetical protein
LALFTKTGKGGKDMIDRNILSERPEDTLAAIQWAKKQKELREKSDALTTRLSKTLAPILSENYQKAMAKKKTMV